MAEPRKSNKIVGVIAVIAIAVSGWFIYQQIQKTRAEDQESQQMFQQQAERIAAQAQRPPGSRPSTRRAATRRSRRPATNLAAPTTAPQPGV